MSDQDEVKNPTDYSEKSEPSMANPPVVRRKTMVDVVIDRAATASSDIVKNVIIPGALELASDSFHSVVDALFNTNGQGRRRSSRSNVVVNNGTNVVTNYNSVSTKPTQDRKRSISDRARANHDFDTILFQNRPEAQDVIDRLRAEIQKYNTVTIEFLYSAMEVEPTFNDTTWGWDDLSGAHVRRARGGFVLDLPEPRPL